MISEVKKGDYVKSEINGKFSENEIFQISIYKKNNKKIVELISDRAEPFIIGLNFMHQGLA